MGENVARVKRNTKRPGHIIYGFIKTIISSATKKAHHIVFTTITFSFSFALLSARKCVLYTRTSPKKLFLHRVFKTLPGAKTRIRRGWNLQRIPGFRIPPFSRRSHFTFKRPEPGQSNLLARGDRRRDPKAAFTTFSATFFSTPAASATASTNAFLLIEATAEYGLFFIYSSFMSAHRREKSIVSIRSISVTIMMMKNVVVVKGSLSREKREQR